MNLAESLQLRLAKDNAREALDVLNNADDHLSMSERQNIARNLLRIIGIINATT